MDPPRQQEQTHAGEVVPVLRGETTAQARLPARVERGVGADRVGIRRHVGGGVGERGVRRGHDAAVLHDAPADPDQLRRAKFSVGQDQRRADRPKPFTDAELAQALESHTFESVKVLQWRNTALDFSSLGALAATLASVPTL